MEKDIVELFLPAGMLEYFKVTGVDKSGESVTIDLEEQNVPLTEYGKQKLTSKGFHEPITVKDFPIRGKSCFLKIKRRRWQIEQSGKTVSRDWDLVAKGTRMTEEFATFLKGIAR